MDDYAIIGGGPSGAFAAILLARAGARVALVDSGTTAPRIEGLSPRVMAILAAHGIEADDTGPAMVRAADWGDLGAAPNREHPVARHRFDAGLRRQAEAAGVRLVTDMASRVDAPLGRVECVSGEVLHAGRVIEARGRRARVAEGALRGPETVSIAAHATGAGRPRIAALPDGWLWEADPPDHPRWVQVTLDAARAREPDTVFRQITGLAPLARPLVRAAELRLSAPELDPDLPRIGDAAVAMDPLSGHGMFWALSSALMLPPMLAALEAGEIGLAARFHRERVVETFWRQARIGRDFYRAARRTGRFWMARSHWPDAAPAHPEIAAPGHRRQVVVRDGRLAEAEVLVTREEPGGAAFVEGVEIVPLLRRLGRLELPSEEIFAIWAGPDIDETRARAIHRWLRARGIDRLPEALPQPGPAGAGRRVFEDMEDRT